MPYRIDLSEFSDSDVLVFAGRARGEAVRRETHIEDIEKSQDHIEIFVPPKTFSINSSFFLGMFGDSIRALGENEFRARYTFTGKPIDRLLRDGVREAIAVGLPLPKPK